MRREAEAAKADREFMRLDLMNVQESLRKTERQVRRQWRNVHL